MSYRNVQEMILIVWDCRDLDIMLTENMDQLLIIVWRGGEEAVLEYLRLQVRSGQFFPSLF